MPPRACCRRARAEAGQAAKLIVDAQMAYRTAEEGLRLLPVLQQVGIWFLEAPLPLDDVAGHARMAGRGRAARGGRPGPHPRG